MTVQLIDGGDALPVEIEAAKLALRIEDDSEDEVLERSLQAAAEFFEEATLRAPVPGTYEQTFDDWPCGPLVLDRAPLRAVEAVEYIGQGSTSWTEIDADDFYVRLREDGLSELRIGSDARPALASRLSNVRVRFTAGYTPAGTTEGERRLRIPRKVEQTLLLLAGHWFENREESTDRPNNAIIKGAEAIIKQSRIFR